MGVKLIRYIRLLQSSRDQEHTILGKHKEQAGLGQEPTFTKRIEVLRTIRLLRIYAFLDTPKTRRSTSRSWIATALEKGLV